MRNKWCISVAAFALIGGGSMLSATGAAAASTTAPSFGHVMVRPGAPARHLTQPFSAIRNSTTSENWSGYAATGSSGSFNSVSASWTEPTGTCNKSGDQYSAFWVGLDGYSSSTVEQTGTEVDCAGHTAEYGAWWEMYPGASHTFSNTVEPGDSFSASVTYSGGEFTLSITDSTQGWTHTEHKTLSSAKRSSAEVIIEAPCCTASGGILPLADFGTANFTSSMANGEAIGDLNPTEITMVSAGGTQEDSISSLSDGENFSGTWLAS
jgi:hypothetical protein